MPDLDHWLTCQLVLRRFSGASWLVRGSVVGRRMIFREIARRKVTPLLSVDLISFSDNISVSIFSRDMN